MTIKPWRERAGLSPAYELHNPSTVEKAMQEEIAELREALAVLPQIPLIALHEFANRYCSDSQHVAVAESAHYWFNKVLANPGISVKDLAEGRVA